MGWTDRFRKKKSAPLPEVKPSERAGSIGLENWSGCHGDRSGGEVNQALQGKRKYATYRNAMLNSPVIATGTRYFMDMIAGTTWTYQPAVGDVDAFYADAVYDLLHNRMQTAWEDVAVRAAMAVMIGSSLQEWIAVRYDDGLVGFSTIESRPIHTIEEWLTDDSGVIGVVQRVGATTATIPISKMLYMVDNIIDDSPQGVGLLRHVIEKQREIVRLEQLEGYGYEIDVNGVPVGWAPLTEVRGLVEKGKVDKDKAKDYWKHVTQFVEGHIKNPSLGIILDSETYKNPDGSSTGVKKYGIDIMSVSNSNAGPIDNSIKRRELQIARVLGIEGILLGADGKGSLALSKDKTMQFAQRIEFTNRRLAGAVKQLLRVLFALNGWPAEMMPVPTPKAVSLRDVETIVAALTAMAGAPFHPDDSASDEVRDLIGISHAPRADLNLGGIADDEIDVDMTDIAEEETSTEVMP